MRTQTVCRNSGAWASLFWSAGERSQVYQCIKTIKVPVPWLTWALTELTGRGEDFGSAGEHCHVNICKPMSRNGRNSGGWATVVTTVVATVVVTVVVTTVATTVVTGQRSTAMGFAGGDRRGGSGDDLGSAGERCHVFECLRRV